MDGDIPWLYVAMIFIAFVSWIYNQIKEAAEIRREKVAEKKRAQRARMSTEPEYESPYRETSSSRDQVPEGPKSFRDVFQEIERHMQEVEVEVEPERTPPPLPTRSDTPPSVPDETLPTTAIPEMAPMPQPTGFPAFGSTKSRRKKRKLNGNRETSDALRKTLRDGHQLKNALILREVLGPPRAKQRSGLPRL